MDALKREGPIAEGEGSATGNKRVKGCGENKQYTPARYVKQAQLRAALRKRERRWCLPYGRWTCEDGRQVLFDRRYCPLVQKYPDQPATLADPLEWVDDAIQKTITHFYDDATPERDKCIAALDALERWNITDEVLAALKDRKWKSFTKAERSHHKWGVRHG